VATSPTTTIHRLRELPAHEREEALEEIVVTQFKAALLMTDEDELPFDQSYFDLGLTSLGLTDLKQGIEQLLDCEIDANTLFNNPTVEQLLARLTADLF
jgi:acyl carrier protein